ncbi:hypothetical protein P7K49_033986 [Saguinus oedipus]|uniref:Uncharacterized protein n=1 Tax=Saguinus oedipus TaxID=9490 RepID=A0ABQ9TTG7_SAGOE|nr:hypothetical protein P7K49_033986 [Saguinus oedipus]
MSLRTSPPLHWFFAASYCLELSSGDVNSICKELASPDQHTDCSQHPNEDSGEERGVERSGAQANSEACRNTEPEARKDSGMDLAVQSQSSWKQCGRSPEESGS